MAEAAKRKYRPGLITYTAVGTLGFSNLYTPDTEGQYASGKYDAKVFFDSEDELNGVRDLAIKEAATEWPKAKPASVLMPWTSGSEYNDKREEDGKDRLENYDGRFLMKAKTKKPVPLFDSAGQKLPEGVKVMSGDKVRLKIELTANTAGGSKRVSPRLCAVQLIEKRADGASDESFDSYEGGFVSGSDDDSQDGAGDTDF